MKVDNIQSVNNISEKPQQQLLKQGDFLTSEVIKVEEGTALLRTAQGTLISARLLGELGLVAGDHVETVVDDAGLGRYVLRLLDIAHDGLTAETGQASTSGAQNLKSQTLYSTLAILKKNVGLDPKAAEFMARNGISATPENIGTLARLVSGVPRVAQMITQMMADAAPVAVRAESVVPDAEGMTGKTLLPTVMGEVMTMGLSTASVTSAMPADSVMQNVLMQALPDVPATTSVATDVPSEAMILLSNTTAPEISFVATESNRSGLPTPDASRSEAVIPQSSETTARPAAVLSSALEFRSDGAVVTNSTPEIRSDGATAANNTPVAGVEEALTFALPQRGADDDSQKPAELLQRLILLFADLKEKETLPTQLKQAAHELPMQLKELKNSLQNADSIDRNTLGQRAEMLDRQQTMLSDIKRFDCYHVPLTNASGNPSTAELYVYRQRRRKTEEQPDSYVVLLGLDTQHMGRVETILRSQGRSVSLEFRLEQASLVEAFEDGAKQLAPLIAQAGYRLGDISVNRLEAKTTVLNVEEMLSEGQVTDTGGLDIRV